MRLFPFLPCHYSSEVFEAVFFLQAQGLHSIWLTWKQMCFHRADWAFIAARRNLGFTASVAFKKKILYHRFSSCSQKVYITPTECLTCTLNEEITTYLSYKI